MKITKTSLRIYVSKRRKRPCRTVTLKISPCSKVVSWQPFTDNSTMWVNYSGTWLQTYSHSIMVSMSIFHWDTMCRIILMMWWAYILFHLLSHSLTLFIPPPSPSNSWIILAYPSLWMTGVSVWDSAALSSSSSRALSSAERVCTAGYWCALASMSVRLLYKINKVFSSRTWNYSRCHYWWLF